MTDVAGGVEVWRGAAAPWECDGAGRLDARFLVAKAMEGLAGLAAALGMDDAFAPAARSTLVVREHHLRCLKAVPAGTPLVMTAGVARMGEDDALVVQVLRDGSGDPCAAVLGRVAHISVREARPFAWSARTRAAADALTLAPPAFARPRGLSSGPVPLGASRVRADELGLPVTGRGVVLAGECDLFGRMRPEAVTGRCLDAAAHLLSQNAGSSPGERAGLECVPLEVRILHPSPAPAGARLELRSGLAAIGARGAKLAHWLLDPAEGEPYAVAMVLGGVVDRGARVLPAAARAALDARRVDGVAF